MSLFVVFALFCFVCLFVCSVRFSKCTCTEKNRQATQPFSWPDNDCKHWAKGVLLALRPSAGEQQRCVATDRETRGKSMWNHRFGTSTAQSILVSRLKSWVGGIPLSFSKNEGKNHDWKGNARTNHGSKMVKIVVSIHVQYFAQRSPGIEAMRTTAMNTMYGMA